MLAADYPLLDILLTILYFFFLFIWIFLVIQVFIDIFSSHDMGGWAKAIWVFVVIVLGPIGVLIYLIARGGKMQQHRVELMKQQQKAFDQAVQQAGGGSNTADQLHKLSELKDKGVLTQAEFDAQKAKILA
jgi:hypothetical protein